ncbi:CD276 antigen-like isoform X1 [Coregonus clupeaformis]|uniref:CD276 antigen-like isoform X1 n=2 Tax=Coregonus clupeaformis TaxID=59861 RepID=UPI001E1C7295|nr:CD276 antigen-like isoform X1 [Coregonus clupeaformis]
MKRQGISKFISVSLLFSAIIEVQFLISPMGVAAPGSDITLSCYFPLYENLNLNNVIVNWQRGESEVVHSYYHGRDQLERQSVVYKGRTHLFEDQIAVGNASLRLSGVQPSDQGQYTCHVTDEQGSTKEKLLLLVAAPFKEPQLSVQSSCDSFFITLNSSQGFPQPNVWWTDSIGGDISNQSHSRIGLDSRGRYEVHSSMEVRPNGTLTIIAEMRLDVLNQSFTRSLTLHPLPECCEVPLATRGRPALVLLGIVLLAGLAMSLILYYRHKPETHQHQMVPRDDTTGQDEAHETET